MAREEHLMVDRETYNKSSNILVDILLLCFNVITVPANLLLNLNKRIDNKYADQTLKRRGLKALLYTFFGLPVLAGLAVLALSVALIGGLSLLLAVPAIAAADFDTTNPKSRFKKASQFAGKAGLSPFALPAAFLLPLIRHVFKLRQDTTYKRAYVLLNTTIDGQPLSRRQQLGRYLWRSVLTVPFLPFALALAIPAAAAGLAMTTVAHILLGCAWLGKKLAHACHRKNSNSDVSDDASAEELLQADRSSPAEPQQTLPAFQISAAGSKSEEQTAEGKHCCLTSRKHAKRM